VTGEVSKGLKELVKIINNCMILAFGSALSQRMNRGFASKLSQAFIHLFENNPLLRGVFLMTLQYANFFCPKESSIR